MDKLIKTIIADRYILESKLDSGGMGSIFLAKDKISKNSVVVKNLHSFKKTENNIKRFQKEAEILKSLNHPNIVSLIEYLNWNGEFYIILEYLKGISLQEKFKEKKTFEITEITNIFMQLLDALEAAHKNSIVHRDLKPSNIFCIPVKGEDDQVKILDFGISLSLEEDLDNRLTRTGEIIGTPYYLSPEQITGKQNISFQSDIYSLGIILYELLAGSPPFTGISDMDILLGHLYRLPDEIQRPDLKENRIYNKYLEIINKSLLKNVDDRFDSIGEIREFFENVEVTEKRRTKRFVNDRKSRHKESYRAPLEKNSRFVTTKKSKLNNFDTAGTPTLSDQAQAKKNIAVFEDDNRSVEMSLIPLLHISNFSLTELSLDISEFSNDQIRPDLIILNVGNEKNLENLNKIKQNKLLKSLPVLICGKEDDLDFISNSINSGATDYIPFPFSPEEIVGKIVKHSDP
ncbi:MAG: serine/threonine-protein kinase [Acidobacteriota bacterium]